MKPLSTPHAGTLALAFAIAACVPQPRSTPPVQTRPAPTPAPAPLPPPVSANWMDAPQTPGDWSYRRAEQQSFAEFASTSGELLFQIECTDERELIFAVARRGAVTGSSRIGILTEAANRTLAADVSEQWVTTRLSARDLLLDAMALSKGRFGVAVPGTATLYLPSWAEVTRVIEDCR